MARRMPWAAAAITMKLSISSVVTWDSNGPAIAPAKAREPYRVKLVDLDEDDAPTKLLSRPTRPRSREIQPQA